MGMKTAIFALGGPSSGPSSSATRYIQLAAGAGTALYTTSTNATLGSPSPAAGTLSTLVVRLGTALSQGSFAFTVMKNAVATGITCTVSSGGATQTNSDLVNTVSVSAGDVFSLRLVPSGTPTAQTILQVSLLFESTSAGESVLFSSIGSGTATDGTFAGVGSSIGSTSTNEVIRTVTFPTGGTISAMYVSADVACGAGTSRIFKLKKNGTVQDGTGGTETTTTTISGTGAGGTTANATFSLAMVAGDTLTIQENITGAPASSQIGIGLKWVPTIDGEGLVFGTNGGSPGTASAIVFNFGGGAAATESTTTNVPNIAPIAVHITKWRGDVSAAPGGGKSRTFAINQNGSNVSSIVLSATAGDSATPNTAVSQGDLLYFSETPATTPSASTFARASAVCTVDSTPPPVAFSASDVNGQTFEGIRNTSAVITGGAYSGTPTDVQVRLIDGSNNQVAAPVSASLQTGGAYLHTFSGVAVGGPYRQQARDNGGAWTTSSSELYVGAVIVLWGQSQCEKLYTQDTSGLTPSATNVRILTSSNKTNMGTATFTITTLNSSVTPTAGITGSGVCAIADQWHTDVGASVPLMLVACAYQGTSIEYWLSDRKGNYPSPNNDPTTLWGTTPTTGLAWAMANAAKYQATAIMMMQGTSDVGSSAGTTYPPQMESLKTTKFETLYTGVAVAPLFLVVPHQRSNDGQYTWLMRNAQYGKAVSGGTWRLCCWLLDPVMDTDTSPHQKDGSTGNMRMGYRIGRGCAKNVYTSGLDIAGATMSTVLFTDLTRNVIEITYAQNIKQADGTAYSGSPITVPPKWFSISSNTGATFGNPGAGLTAAITAANKVRLTTTGAAFSQSVTNIDYGHGVPLTSDVGYAAEYVGPIGTVTMTADTSSNTSLNVTVISGTVAVGDTVTGSGIPAGTWLTTAGSAPGTYSMNKSATATASGVALTVARNESLIEANFFAKGITDTSSFESNRGMPASPVMGTGFNVGEAGSGGATAARQTMSLSLGLRL